jgi:hypothetical protein
MTAATILTREIVDGTVYLVTEYRGVRYSLTRWGQGWGVSTRRLAIGGFNPGGFKTFATLADVQAKCKAFAGADLLAAI